MDCTSISSPAGQKSSCADGEVFWKTAKPFTVDEIDMGKFDFSKGVTNDPNAQKV